MKNGAQRCVFYWLADVGTGICSPFFEQAEGACDGVAVESDSKYSRWTVCANGAPIHCEAA